MAEEDVGRRDGPDASNPVQSIGLANGLVDNKVAAIDDTWSGLRFVYRTPTTRATVSLRNGA